MFRPTDTSKGESEFVTKNKATRAEPNARACANVIRFTLLLWALRFAHKTTVFVFRLFCSWRFRVSLFLFPSRLNVLPTHSHVSVRQIDLPLLRLSRESVITFSRTHDLHTYALGVRGGINDIITSTLVNWIRFAAGVVSYASLKCIGYCASNSGF